MNDAKYLTELVSRAGLVEGVDWCVSREYQQRVTCFMIRAGAWWSFFADEYWTKYAGADKLADADPQRRMEKERELSKRGIQIDTLASAKWFASWVLTRLNRAQGRLVIEGLRSADGISPVAPQQSDTNKMEFECAHVILTSSISFRDQLIQLALHSGYSATFDVNTLPVSDSLKVEMDAADPTLKFSPLDTNVVSWAVCYSDLSGINTVDVGCDGDASTNVHNERDREPAYIAASSPYDGASDGRVWCVTVDHGDALIIAQRVGYNQVGEVTNASRPIVIGNCFQTHAKLPRRRKPILQHGRFNYIPTRCRYVIEEKECPQGVHCRFSHVTEEVIYHASKFRTQRCSHPIDKEGCCAGYGAHCAKAHGPLDLRQPVFESTDDAHTHRATQQDFYEFVCPPAQRELERKYYMFVYKTKKCVGFPFNCSCDGLDYHRPEERRRGPIIKVKHNATHRIGCATARSVENNDVPPKTSC